jgi:hypothetical protein
MYQGQYCRWMSSTQDDQIQRSMGSRDIDEFVAHMEMDASGPDQLDALAHQLLCCARRCKTAGFKPQAKEWKTASIDVAEKAAQARARLAANPSRETHPGFWDKRSIGRPKCLDSDLFLPLLARLDLGRPTMHVASYTPELVDGATYRLRPAQQNGRAMVAFMREDGAQAILAAPSLARGLQAMGRLVALPLSALKMAA